MAEAAQLAHRARRLAAPVGRPVRRLAVGARTRSWPDHSRLFVVGDRAGWSVDEDAEHVAAAARRLGYAVGPPAWARFVRRQSVFHTSHFEALTPPWLDAPVRIGLAYMHGRPGTPGMPEFDAAYAALARAADRVARVQVTHRELEELVLGAGVPAGRVFRIPLGIDLEHFALRTPAAAAAARAALGVPAQAFVVGSFQKDGVGWGAGEQPKTIKGPDVLLAALARVRAAAPELFVLLTGPARGYVRAGLARLGIPHAHVLARSRRELARAYHALDAYLVASRQEGGPKAVLESMATGVPLVTTRVGQAVDLVEDGANGLLADVEDAEALAAGVLRVRDDAGLRARLADAGRAKAEAYRHEALDPAWAELLEGFVARG